MSAYLPTCLPACLPACPLPTYLPISLPQGAVPDLGFKVVGTWVFGTQGMLSYCGLAGSDNVQVSA